MDLYEMSIDSFKSTLVFKNDDALNIGDVSKNKKYLALSKTYTRDNSDVYLYDFDSKNLKIAVMVNIKEFEKNNEIKKI